MIPIAALRSPLVRVWSLPPAPVPSRHWAPKTAPRPVGLGRGAVQMGAKTGASALRLWPTQRDPRRAFAQVRRSGPRGGFPLIGAFPPDLLRDEEAAGSNPATLTR